jgi:hypothetical protein
MDEPELKGTDYIPLRGIWKYCSRNKYDILNGIESLVNNGNLRELDRRKIVKNTLERTAFLTLYNATVISLSIDIINSFLD